MQRVAAWLKSTPKLAAGIASIVGLIAGVLALISWFAPDVKPKPAAPTDAKLEMIDFQRHVTLGSYLRSTSQDSSAYDAEGLARDGVVATVRVANASGVRRAVLRWTLRDVVSGHDVDDPNYVHQRAAEIRIATTGDSGGGEFWVPAPPVPGRYVAVFELDKQDGGLIAKGKTEEFVVAA